MGYLIEICDLTTTDGQLPTVAVEQTRKNFYIASTFDQFKSICNVAFTCDGRTSEDVLVELGTALTTAKHKGISIATPDRTNPHWEHGYRIDARGQCQYLTVTELMSIFVWHMSQLYQAAKQHPNTYFITDRTCVVYTNILRRGARIHCVLNPQRTDNLNFRLEHPSQNRTLAPSYSTLQLPMVQSTTSSMRRKTQRQASLVDDSIFG